MEKIGQVISNNESNAKVQVWRASACGEKCGSCSGGCSTTSMYIEAKNMVSARPGQMVKVEMETKKVLKASASIYIFPLVMLILGIFMGYEIFSKISLRTSPDIFAFFIGLLFMAASFFIVKIIYNRKHIKENMEYHITKKF